MSNTVHLLETIGADASLRHAPSAVLASALAQANASDALKGTIMQDDASLLFTELGELAKQKGILSSDGPISPQVTNAVWREDA